MKTKTTKKLFALFTTIMLSVSILVIYNSCQKEISADISKTNGTATTNTPSSSKIVYTDVNPDITISATLGSLYGSRAAYYNVDLDKNGINDFEFEVYALKPRNEAGGFGAGVLIMPALSRSGNEVAIDSGHVVVLDSLAVIDSSSATWLSGTSRLTVPDKNWNPDTAYLGLKLIKGSNIYYGWIRLSNVYATFPFLKSAMTIMDYAYNSIPNQPILAGQTK
jgi:hypothetical protein